MSDEQKELTQKIRWLLLLRVVIVSFFLGATALFHFLRTEGKLGYLFDLSIPLIVAYVSVLKYLAEKPEETPASDPAQQPSIPSGTIPPRILPSGSTS